MSHDDNGPAFPHVCAEDCIKGQGMSLRDWFTGMALQGLTAATFQTDQACKALNQAADEEGLSPHEFLAQTAFRLADAMLKARRKTQ